MTPWRLTRSEGRQLLRHLLPTPQPKRGGHKSAGFQAIVEACLFSHYKSHAPRYCSFGWNQLPPDLAVIPSTANRYFLKWKKNGAWLRFWDALQESRRSVSPVAVRSPVTSIVQELERGYAFLNHRFFAGLLPHHVAITLEFSSRINCHGYFRPGYFLSNNQRYLQIGISAMTLLEGAQFVFGVLLHEMVHLRNWEVGLKDCSPSTTHYHNANFRDTALLAGLECSECDQKHGYAETRLSTRGEVAIRELAPDEKLFSWELDAPVSKRKGRASSSPS